MAGAKVEMMAEKAMKLSAQARSGKDLEASTGSLVPRWSWLAQQENTDELGSCCHQAAGTAWQLLMAGAAGHIRLGLSADLVWCRLGDSRHEKSMKRI